MEASHNADPREALWPGRDGGLRTACLARLGARDASLAAIAVAACLEGLLPTVSPSKSPPDLQPISSWSCGPALRLTQGRCGFASKLARPANQAASQSAWQPRIIWIYPRTSLTPATAVSCVPEITDTEAVARAQRDSSSDGNAVTSAAVHRARFAPFASPRTPATTASLASLNQRVGVRFPRGAPSRSQMITTWVSLTEPRRQAITPCGL